MGADSDRAGTGTEHRNRPGRCRGSREAFLVIFCLILSSLPVSSAAARLTMKEYPVAELPADDQKFPVAFLVDETGRLTILDATGGALILFDESGKPAGRVALLRHPELSRFALQDFCQHEGQWLILELTGHQVLVFRDGRRIGTIPLPAECVLPLRIGTTGEGLLSVYDLQNARTLILDGQGRVIHRREYPLDEYAHGRRLYYSWDWLDRERKAVSLRRGDDVASPGTEFYKLHFPRPVERLDLLGADNNGDLYVRVDMGYGLQLETWIARIGAGGVKRWLLSCQAHAEAPVGRELLLGRDGQLYALHRYPKTWLITRLVAETQLED